jgi:drug/metabolite transporter (DMT)-like permease
VTLPADVVAIVLVAGVLHAVWNAIARQIADRLMAFALIGVASTLGGGLTLIATGLPASAALPFAFGSAVLHVLYETGLMRCYGLGAFNQTYPIARGTSPLVVAVGAYLIAGERLPAAAVAGILVLTSGLLWLAASSGRIRRADRPAIVAALLTGLAIAAYTLVDGLGVRRAHDPAAYGALLFLLQGPVFPALAIRRRSVTAWRDAATTTRGLLAGGLSLFAYGAVLWAQTRAPLAEVAALRETSVISAALIGALFLNERFGARRAAAATLVAAGIILISV